MTVLKVDWDRPQPPRLGRLSGQLRRLGVRPLRALPWVQYTRTRRGWHVVIPVRGTLDPVTTVAVQFALGSDRARERFNLARALGWPAGFHRWGNVLFQRKVA